MQVPAGNCLADPSTVQRETSQGDSIGAVGVHGRKGIGLGGSEGMSDVQDLAECGVDRREGTVAQLHGDGVKSGDLSISLDNVERVGVR